MYGPDSRPLDKRGELSANAGGGTRDPPNYFAIKLMTCFFVWVAVILSLPVVLLFRATETKGARICRLRANNHKWKSIASRYGVSVTTVRRWSMA